MATAEEIEERRAKRKAALAAQRAEQYAQDLEALDELEIEHGDDAIVRVDVGRYAAGLPTLVALRLPRPVEMKRYQQMVTGPKGGTGDPIKAAHVLASACVLYPAKDVYEQLCERFAGLHTNAAVAAIHASQGKAEEGKGD